MQKQNSFEYGHNFSMIISVIIKIYTQKDQPYGWSLLVD